MDPFFLGYLLLPLGYTTALAALSASAERALIDGNPEKALKLLSWARKAPFFKTYRSMCEVNLITAAYSLERFDLVDEVWQELEPKLESLRPYAGSALASYGATLIGRGRYKEACAVLLSPLRDPKPNQKVDNIAVHCFAFCQANLASALISLGEKSEASQILDGLSSEQVENPLLNSLVIFLRSFLFFLNGQPENARHLASQLNFASLPVLYRTELRYHLATLLARCDDPVWAEKVVSGIEWDTSTHRKLMKLRTQAMAEIHAAQGDLDLALSYFSDLRRLQYRGALGYLRAAALAQRVNRLDLQTDFLQAASELDPESHWAELAQRKLAILNI